MKIIRFFDPETLAESQKLGYSCARQCVAPWVDFGNSRAASCEEVVDEYV